MTPGVWALRLGSSILPLWLRLLLLLLLPRDLLGQRVSILLLLRLGLLSRLTLGVLLADLRLLILLLHLLILGQG